MRGFGATLTLLLIATVFVAGVALFRGWTTWLEAFGFVTGAVCVWLTAKENIWNWPVGLLNSAAYAYMFYQGQLLADGVLNGIYFVLGVFGWYWWLHGGKDHKEVHIGSTAKKEWGPLFAIALLATTGLTVWLYTHSDAAPFLDASTSVFSLVAQYLLTRKYIENWLVWIAVDIVYVPLYAWKGWYLTALLYAIFLVMAVGGLREWARLRAEQTETAPVVPMWRSVQVALALGAAAAGWIGLKCWEFEAFFGDVLAVVRASDSGSVIRAGAASSEPLDPGRLSAIRAEVLDPLSWRPGPRWTTYSGPGRHTVAILAFVAGDQRATFEIDSWWQASFNGKTAVVDPWIRKLPIPIPPPR